ncbi:hypothetical protein [Arthrobacter echini]|uniref:hypothetical protein n=1 Tax=Arthrobacter echini TaxID=1529066 RepID=UPI00292A3F7F|nr:hypothetical protein [Arthrobacter echini]
MDLTTRASRVGAAFVRIADTLVDEYDSLDLLHTLVEETVALLDATAAGLMLAGPDGVLQVLASTSEESHLVDVLQQKTGVGPCVECYTTGVPLRARLPAAGPGQEHRRHEPVPRRDR